MYSVLTQKLVTLLEQGLCDEKGLDDYARQMGYSKFHLLRLFKQETGMTIGEYMRIRRLAMAATYLFHTEMSIIAIAFELQYQSQEAFSRSFKEVYHLSPGKYRKVMRDIILVEGNTMNDSLSNGVDTSSSIKGWVLSGSKPHLYDIKLDNKVFHTGTKSGLLQSKSEVSQENFGTMMQSFSAKKWHGKRFKLSCFIRTEDVVRCGAWCRVDNQNGDIIQFDNMDNRPIFGTTEWNHYAIVLDCPIESESINIGVLLVGTGKVWVDGFKLEEVTYDIPSTNMLQEDYLLLEPVNLGFEEV